MTINASELRFRLSGGYVLPYDNIAGGPFTVGETITGGTSGATADIDGDHDTDDDGILDTLRISNIAGGPFQDDEQITGGTSAATADVNSASGEFLNTDPNLSLGGRQGDTTLDMQGQAPFYTGSPIPGVGLLRCGGGSTGDFTGEGGTTGQLRFTASGTTLEVRWPESTGFGDAIDISVDGTYHLVDSDGKRWIEVTVTAASLPVGDQTSNWEALQLLNELFRNFTKEELVPTVSLYRLIYIVNTNSTDDFLKVELTLDKQSTSIAVQEAMGLDPVSLGDGLTTGVAQAIADEFTAPGSVTFSIPTPGDLDIVPLSPGEAIPLWVRATHLSGFVAPISLIAPRIGSRVFF